MARTPNPLTVAELEAFFDRLKDTILLAQEAVRIKAALSGFTDLRAGPTGQQRRAPAARRARGGRRGGRSVAPDSILGLLKDAKEGASVGTVAAKLGAAKPRVAVALRRLRDEKKVKLVGQRRQARWFVV